MPLTKIQSLGITDGTIVNADINASAAIAGTKISGSFGKVLQVVSTTKTDTFSTSSTSFVDVTGLSVSITPSSASNKILVIASIYAGNNTQYSHARLVRDSTAICIGDAFSSNSRVSFNNFYTADSSTYKGGTQNFLDSPATTSATTYKVQLMAGSATVYLNYGGTADTDFARGRTASTITVMEIAG